MNNQSEPEFATNLFNNLLETWVVPEIKRRQAAEELESPLHLNMAQIVFDLDGPSPQVRINQQVRGEATFKLQDGQRVDAGHPVYASQIEELESFQLLDSEQDCGHATILRVGDKWFITFDFIYNKKRSAAHIRAASEFLATAKLALDAGHFRSFVENLASASELGAKAYLLSRPDRSIMKSKTHGMIHSRINIERRRGNVEEDHVNSYNDLQQIRSSARYLSGEFEIGHEEVQRLYDDICGFIEEVKTRLPVSAL